MIWCANKRSGTKLPYNLCGYFLFATPNYFCEYATAKDHSSLASLKMFSLTTDIASTLFIGKIRQNDFLLACWYITFFHSFPFKNRFGG